MDPLPTTGTANAPPIALLGVAFDNLSMNEAVEAIDAMIRSRQPHYVITPNVDFLVQALQDIELKRILVEAHLVLCDGKPLVWASKLLGNRLRERVAGSDLAPLLLEVAARKGYRVFLLGGTPEAMDRAREKLRLQFPKLVVCGTCSPPFATLLEMDHEQIVTAIRQARPDLLLVCFGCPKQEKWMWMHYRSLGVPVLIGVGAVVDFLGGTMKRAPQWMRHAGLEWLFRLAQEPRRLFRRYWRDFVWFGRMLVSQWRTIAHQRGNPSTEPLFAKSEIQDRELECVLPEWIDAAAVQTHGAEWENAIAQSRWLMEASHIRFIDSTGVAFLIRLQKKARADGQKLVLVAPSANLLSTLQLMQLTPMFATASDLNEARQINRELPVPAVKPQLEQRLFWRGEVTAANVDEVWSDTAHYLEPVRCLAAVTIDLSELRFIDSAGVGLMLRLRKRARQQQVRLRFTGMQPAVRNVLQLAKLEFILLEETT